METLIAEEAARLYEERFGSTTAGDVADLSPLSESVMQTLLKRFSRNEEVDDGGGGVRQETTPRRSIYLCLQPLQWMKVAGVLVLHSKTVPSLHVLKFENKAGAT